MNKQSQRLELTLKQDVINGFSYSFTNSLLKGLKKLKKEDKIFEDGWGNAEEIEARDHRPSRTTGIACVVIEYLKQQLIISSYSAEKMLPTDVNNLITTSEEFLSIFSSEKK